ncbi:uncharacterized protein [Miscanthus floridulus]|uniref:uncharacterized protein n=1 Tax=Miscanthus floridulus TaxID=154761 RepID=UPI0034577E70
MSSRKYASGSEKRKKKAQIDEFIQSQRSSMHKFLKNNPNTSRDPNKLAIVVWKEPTQIIPEDEGPPDDNVGINMEENNVSNDEHIFNSNTTENSSLDEEQVDDTSGSGLFNVLVDSIKSFGLNIDDIRGQGYDNGSNMKGKHKGVQSRLRDINPRDLNDGYASSKVNATEIASEMGVEPSFPVKRRALRKKHFDENNSEEALLEGEKEFKVSYFTVIIDMTVRSLETRFQELESFRELFGFLMSSANLKALDGPKLKLCCTTLAAVFSLNSSSDIDLNDLISKLSVLQFTLPDTPMTAMEIFEFVTKADCYPNASIAYRILFTIHVTVASTERSFSKLKLLKNYLRSTMSPERLNGLATLCIEKRLLDEIDIDTIINDFASRNVRRKF